MNFSDFFSRHEDGPVTPEEEFVRVDEDLMKAAEALKPFVQTPAFKILVELVQSRRREVATQALEDETRTKDWWKGYHSGTGSLDELVKAVISQAEIAHEERGTDEEASERMPSAGGDFSI